MSATEELLRAALDDAHNGWSIGTFGVIGEFVRDDAEPFERSRHADREEVVTARGGLGVHVQGKVISIAYDTLSSDGETWGHALAFCLSRPSGQRRGAVVGLGADREALQEIHRTAQLFDLGVGVGHVSLCVRTADETLIRTLSALEGKPLLGANGAQAVALIARLSPHRIALSPLARIEVYAPIPPPGGRSPAGPHTHLIPKLLGAGRTHGSNVPLPETQQAVLTLHRSPWRDHAGARTAFDERANRQFEQLLERFGLPEDREIRAATQIAVINGVDPATYHWPATRRGRTQARITLRRLAQRLGSDCVARWKSLYDRGPMAEEPEEDPTEPLGAHSAPGVTQRPLT